MTAQFALMAEAATRQTFQWGRIQSNLDWILPGVVAALLALFVVLMYRFDCRELGGRIAVVLISLRLAAIAGLVLLYAEPQWRTERVVKHDSRVLVLADTSRSMARSDATGQSGTSATRSQQVIDELQHGKLLGELRARHEVIVARFDQDTSRIVTLAKLPPDGAAVGNALRGVPGGSVRNTTGDSRNAAEGVPYSARRGSESPGELSTFRRIAAAGLGLFLISLVAYPIVWLLRGRSLSPWPWVVVGVGSLVVALAVTAWLDLTHPRTPLIALLGLDGWIDPGESSIDKPSQPSDSSPQPPAPSPPDTIDWSQVLAPQGNETRLGDALRQWVHQQRGSPLAGIVVITDGGQNAGSSAEGAVELAREARVRFYPIGLGTTDRPVNVAVTGLEAPARAYPGDGFKITGYVQADGLAGRTATIEVTSREATADATAGAQRSELVRQVTLGADGEVVPVELEISGKDDDGNPLEGRRVYAFHVDAPQQDANDRDNSREAVVEIVDRKNRVLLLAGGPTREYRFLRNLLYRDKDTLVDVVLQSARPGIAQDANKVLDEFPISPGELADYDAIVAFDFDWRQLGEDQIDLLDDWVAREAGGLIVVSGPVYSGRWVSDPRTLSKMTKIRSLYPVRFKRSFSNLVDADDDRFQRDEPHPLQFTREGLEAAFLHLVDDPAESQQLWAGFEGVYGYFAVEGPKQGATVYAYFDDPAAVGEVGTPIYLAEQFYGAGRVFYMGSGEMWRLRAMDDAHFERFYTKLIRHVSQGRLLRGSKHGVLTVSSDLASVGQTIQIRANLKDARNQPLRLPKVDVQYVRPDGVSGTLTLAGDTRREGSYEGQLALLEEGLYRLELVVPGAEGEILSRTVDARVPNLERDHSLRNDKLLQELALGTDGSYYVGLAAARGEEGNAPLAAQLPDRTETSFEPGVLDKMWEQKWMRWAMVLVVGCLSLEWLLRRLWKLA